MRALRRFSLLLVFSSWALPLVASDLSNLESRLRSEYVGHLVTLNYFLPGKSLDFDYQGESLSRSKPDSWTTAGEVEVTDLRLQPELLQINGLRVLLVYGGNGMFQSLFPISASVGNGLKISGTLNGNFRRLEKRRPVVLSIHLQPGMAEDAILSALNRVVARPDTNITEVVPSWWKAFFLGPGSRPEGTKSDAVFGPKDGVSPPNVIQTPDPPYSDIARDVGLEGTTVLSLVLDAVGKPEDISVVRPLGLGLDEKAVETVSNWRFLPGKKSGESVRVRINIEVRFRLH